jgi:hypothetical protein
MRLSVDACEMISDVNAVLLIASAATPAVRALIGIPYRGRTRNRI